MPAANHRSPSAWLRPHACSGTSGGRQQTSVASGFGATTETSQTSTRRTREGRAGATSLRSGRAGGRHSSARRSASPGRKRRRGPRRRGGRRPGEGRRARPRRGTLTPQRADDEATEVEPPAPRRPSPARRCGSRTRPGSRRGAPGSRSKPSSRSAPRLLRGGRTAEHAAQAAARKRRVKQQPGDERPDEQLRRDGDADGEPRHPRPCRGTSRRAPGGRAGATVRLP